MAYLALKSTLGACDKGHHIFPNQVDSAEAKGDSSQAGCIQLYFGCYLMEQVTVLQHPKEINPSQPEEQKRDVKNPTTWC